MERKDIILGTGWRELKLLCSELCRACSGGRIGLKLDEYVTWKMGGKSAIKSNSSNLV